MSAQRIARRRSSATKQAAVRKESKISDVNFNNNVERTLDEIDQDIDLTSYNTGIRSNPVDEITRRKSRGFNQLCDMGSAVLTSRVVTDQLEMRTTYSSMPHHSLNQSNARTARLETSSQSESEVNLAGLPSCRPPSQSNDLITPRSWSDMIASDIGEMNGHNSTSPAEHSSIMDRPREPGKNDERSNHFREKNDDGVRKRLYVQDVTFHDDEPNGPISPLFHQQRSFELKEELITPRTWSEMISEDSLLFGPGLQKTHSVEDATFTPDPLAESIEFAWPRDSSRNGSSNDDGKITQTRTRSKGDCNESISPALARIEWNVRMLRRELVKMRQTDQHIFRQLLGNYETIGRMFDHVTVTTVTPSPSPSPSLSSPYPVSARSTPCTPEKTSSHSATGVGDADLLRIIRDALAQPGVLNIRDIVTRLSPIRRRRSSEPPPTEYEDLPLDFDAEEFESSFEDLLSFSCPVFKEPSAPIANKNS